MPDRKLTPQEIQQQMTAGTRRARAYERIQRDPVTSLVEGAKAFGNSPAAYVVNPAVQETMGRSKHAGVRGAGRVVGEAPLYIDQIIPLLRLMDKDVDEKDRAIALGHATALLGTNALKDYLIARGSKGGKMSGGVNAITDNLNPIISSLVGKYYTKPYEALGNVSAAEIMYQAGKILPPTFLGLPSIPQLMEMGAQHNIARTPFVKGLKTQTDRIDDTLTEDEVLYQLMRLRDKNTPVPDDKYVYHPTSKSKDQKTKADILNAVSKTVTFGNKTILPFSNNMMSAVTDPEQYARMVYTNAMMPKTEYQADPLAGSKGRGTGGKATPLK